MVSPISSIPFLFPPPGIVGTPVMATLNLPGITLGIPVWYLTPPNPPPTPQLVLTPVQPVGTANVPPPVVSHD